MTNTSLKLEKNNILAFLVKPNNGFTEHYVSSQPLNLYIPYTQYLSLVKELIYLNLNILRTDISTYKNAISYGDFSTQMLKLYHYDIALAGLEELHKSNNSNHQCTRIFGLIDEYKGKFEVKTISYDNSAEFLVANFSQDERTVFTNLMLKKKSLDFKKVLETDEIINNGNMLSIILLCFGVYISENPKFIISIEEE